jgi:hypothetical protein
MATENIDILQAAATDAVAQAHCWDAQLFIKLTSAILISSKNPSLFGLPVTVQDVFVVGTDPAFR